MLGYYALRLALLPGIVLHELSHYYFCRLVGAEIREVCFFSFGYPAGYVIHTAPRRFRAHCVIAMGPLLITLVRNNREYMCTLRPKCCKYTESEPPHSSGADSGETPRPPH